MATRPVPPTTKIYLQQKLVDFCEWKKKRSWDDSTQESNEARFRSAMIRLKNELNAGAPHVARDPDNLKVLIMLFSSEIWQKESNLHLANHDVSFEIFKYIEDGDLDGCRKCLPSSLDTRAVDKLIKKARNIQQVAMKLYGLDQSDDWSAPSRLLSIPFLQEVHQGVMEGIDQTSKIRTLSVGAARTDRIYVDPVHIETQLEGLIVFVNHALPKTEGIENRIHLATYFLSRFLFIHPFKNGNGRLGRLLFSWLLRHDTVFPISITAKRTNYIQAIYLSQGDGSKPDLLKALVAEGIAESAWNANFCFDRPARKHEKRCRVHDD